MCTVQFQHWTECWNFKFNFKPRLKLNTVHVHVLTPDSNQMPCLDGFVSWCFYVSQVRRLEIENRPQSSVTTVFSDVWDLPFIQTPKSWESANRESMHTGTEEAANMAWWNWHRTSKVGFLLLSNRCCLCGLNGQGYGGWERTCKNFFFHFPDFFQLKKLQSLPEVKSRENGSKKSGKRKWKVGKTEVKIRENEKKTQQNFF